MMNSGRVRVFVINNNVRHPESIGGKVSATAAAIKKRQEVREGEGVKKKQQKEKSRVQETKKK